MACVAFPWGFYFLPPRNKARVKKKPFCSCPHFHAAKVQKMHKTQQKRLLCGPGLQRRGSLAPKIHNYPYLECKPKWLKSVYPFSVKRPQNHTLLGQHIYLYGLYQRALSEMLWSAKNSWSIMISTIFTQILLLWTFTCIFCSAEEFPVGTVRTCKGASFCCLKMNDHMHITAFSTASYRMESYPTEVKRNTSKTIWRQSIWHQPKAIH